jgi:DNA-binding CsgD family transcriptional regulator
MPDLVRVVEVKQVATNTESIPTTSGPVAEPFSPLPGDPMSKSSCLRAADIHSLYQVAGECRDLGDDPRLWRQHCFARLAGLTGAGLVVGGEFIGCLSGRPQAVGTADWGWDNGFNRAGWVLALTEFRINPLFCPMLQAYFAQLAREDGVSLSRRDFLTDREWYPSPYYRDVQSVMGGDETLQCWRAIAGAPDQFNDITLCRATRDRGFTGRVKAIVGQANALIAPLIGGSLARFTEPAPSELTPRVREVLRCLLEGDGDKQIAARLGISPYTVNVHTKVIYQHFNVQSRAELLARWIRRGWGSRCAWAAEHSPARSAKR